MSQLPELTGPAGGAFLLSEPAPLSTDYNHPEGRVVVREGAANITVNLVNSQNKEDVKAVAWRVIQESLDFLAARRRPALSTAMGDSQFVLWSRNGNCYDLTSVDTLLSSWSINGHVAVGGVRPAPSKQTFEHHDALRFYRMSQCARGLFDAYRNAYLALECLVSDVDPKRSNESELNWLKRVIESQLKKAVPSGLDWEPTLDAIYKHGRNPLFHAKITETFYPPHGEQREEIQQLFERLTVLLVSLLQYKLGTDTVRRWATMSRRMQDTQTRAMLDFDEICFEGGADRITVTPTVEVIESPRRFGQLWAKVFVERPKNLFFLKRVQFLSRRREWLNLELEEAVETSNVATVAFELNSTSRNLYAPKAFHSE